MGYLDKALEAMQQQGGRIVNHDLLDVTLMEIGREYKPGLISWIGQDSDRWKRLLQLEDQINRASPWGDEVGVRESLEAYRLFFQEMTKTHDEREQGNLF